MKAISKNTMIQVLSIIAVLGAALFFPSPCSAQTISTIAGDGTAGYSGDGGPATSAQLNRPISVFADSSGNIFVADSYNHCVRMIDASGNISTVAGTGTGGYSGDGGPAASAQLNEPNAIYADSSGNIFIADRLNNCVRMIDPSGNISTVAGTGTEGYSGDGGPATSAKLGSPTCVYADSSGNIFVADRGNERIRMFTVGGNITTVAGNGTTGYSGDGGPATSATFNGPNGICADSSGNIFVADRGSNCIRMFTVGGTITTVAGTGVGAYSGDGGPATSARLNYPYGVCADSYDNIFVADRGNNVIRVFTVAEPSAQLPEPDPPDIQETAVPLHPRSSTVLTDCVRIHPALSLLRITLTTASAKWLILEAPCSLLQALLRYWRRIR